MLHGCYNSWIKTFSTPPDLFQISFLEPRFRDLHIFLVADLPGQDPIELFATSESVLDDVGVVADPDVDAVVAGKVFTSRLVFQIRPWKVGAKAGVAA
jgi:hypothetical protein